MDSPPLVQFLCNSLPEARRDSASYVMRRICPELRSLIRFLCDPHGADYSIVEILMGGREVQLLSRDGGAAQEKCAVLFLDLEKHQRRWSHTDSIAFSMVYFKGADDLNAIHDLLIVVVDCDVEADATNAGFHPLAHKRCVPISLAHIQSLESIPRVQEFCPRVVMATEAAEYLGIEVAQLAELPVLKVDDPIVICDVRHIRIGSFVYCPGGKSSAFRIVASCGSTTSED